MAPQLMFNDDRFSTTTPCSSPVDLFLLSCERYGLVATERFSTIYLYIGFAVCASMLYMHLCICQLCRI